jgi:hypothetical protein
VVLLGCFHGTSSSAEDVRKVLAAERTNVVVLELCPSRFSDLQRELLRQTQGKENSTSVEVNHPYTQRRLWPVRYLTMVTKTVQTRGLPTGLAAAVLGGFSGLQSAMSGFTPGLEFTTALELCTDNNGAPLMECDIILADQAVDETLRKLGNLPTASSEIYIWERKPDGRRKKRDCNSIWKECRLHLLTLQQAIFGNIENENENMDAVPQVKLAAVLLRNRNAIADLLRLALPSIFLIFIFSRLLAVTLGGGMDDPTMSSSEATLASWLYHDGSNAYDSHDSIDGEIIKACVIHGIASGIIVMTGFVVMVPIVKIILTERGECNFNIICVETEVEENEIFPVVIVGKSC